MADESLLPQPPGGMAPGAALALLVHAGLGVALALAVDWHMRAPEVVSAELWASLPQIAAPKAAVAVPAVPAPTPPPPTPAPAPAPKAAPPPAPEPQIATERAERRKLAEQKARAEEAEAERKREEKREEKRQADERQREADDKAREVQLARLREDQLKRMLGSLPAGSGTPTSTGTAAQDRAPSQAYAGRLVALLRGNLIYADRGGANPSVEVRLRMTASGTILASSVVRPSGNKDYDEAVLRAIEKTGRLPADSDGRVPQEISVVFRLRD